MTNPTMADPANLLADLDFVRRLAQRLCGDEHTAEDVAQQTIVTALQNPPQEGNFRGWLATVARSLVYKQHRGNSRRVAREQASARGVDEPSTEEVLEREQVRTEVVKAVLDLGVDHRQIILLRYYRGASVSECAERIGITESAIRSRTARAIECLRARLDQHHDGDRQRWSTILLPLALPRSEQVAAAAVRRSVLAMLAAALLVTATWAVATTSFDPAAAPSNRVSTPAPAQQDEQAVAPVRQPVRHDVTPQTEQPPRWWVNGLVKSEDTVAVGATVRSWLTLGSPDVADWVELPAQQTDKEGRYAIPLRELESWSELARAHAGIVVVHSLAGCYSDDRYAMCAEVIKAPGMVHFTAHLNAGARIRGRLLRPDGSPVANRELAEAFAETHIMRQTFADGTFQACGADGATVISCGDAAHGQFLRTVDLTGKPSTDLGDVRLDDTGPFLTGTARYPDGTPLADIPVWMVDRPGPEGDATIEIDGIKFPNGTVLTRRNLYQGRTTRTDENGRFRMLHGGPGGYRLTFGNGSVFGKDFEITKGGSQDLDVVFESRYANSHIKLVAQDEDGRVLHRALVKWHIWKSDKAPIARARYEREGYVDDLLATADKLDNTERFTQRREPLVALRNDSFTLFEVSIGGAKTVRVPCHLPAGSHSKTLRVVLAPPRQTSPLRLEAVTAAGEVVTPLFVRVRQRGARQSASLKLAARPPEGGASVRISGAWYAVPASGNLELPVGTYDVDLLAGGKIDRGLLRGSDYPITQHTVTVQRDQPNTLRAELSVGARMRLQVATPRGFNRKSLSIAKQRVTLTPSGAGRPITMLFEAPNFGRFDQGTITLVAEQGIAAGEYRVALQPKTSRTVANQDPSLRQRYRMVNQDWLPVDQLVFFNLNTDPFPVQLVEATK